MFTLIGHIPWLARLLLLIPGSTNDLKKMRNACFEWATARKKRGSKQKDLFYYLVSTENVAVPFSVEVLTQLYRLHSPTNSVQKKRKYHSRSSSTMAMLLSLPEPIPRSRSSHPSSFTFFAIRRSLQN